MSKYTPKDVAQLIANVEEAFTAQLAKAKESSLAKSEDGEKDHKEESKEEHKPEHKEEAPKHESKEHSSEEPAKEDHKEAAPEHKEEQHSEGHDYDAEDLAHMEKMYSSMSDGEKKAHHDCLSKCMGGSASKPAEMSKNEDASQKRGNGGEMSACEPKNVPGAKSPASAADGDQMNKSENTEVELLKSELAAEKAEKAAIKDFLTALAKKTAPQGKAITSLDVIAKSEAPAEEKVLSKKEIHDILVKKSGQSDLKKSDRDAINSYYLDGQINVNAVSHLLK